MKLIPESVKFKKIFLPAVKPVFFIVVILLAAVNFALGLPQVVDLVQTKLVAGNVAYNVVNGSNYPQLGGVLKSIPPPKSLGISPPALSATSALVMDLEDGFLFFVKDPNKRVPIASTTKIMTALVAVANFSSSQILTVPDVSSVPGSKMGLKKGENLIFRSLLYGLLLNSGNDAAETIAANFPGGITAFVEEMNRQAKEMGLSNTHFDNPAGFDSPTHFSSAQDLAKISSLASENSQLALAFATKEAIVASENGESVYSLKNLNKLLDIPGVLGIKTGTTPEARENLVGLIEKDNRRILTVVLGSNDRFGETKKLLDWVYTDFIW